MTGTLWAWEVLRPVGAKEKSQSGARDEQRRWGQHQSRMEPLLSVSASIPGTDESVIEEIVWKVT